MAFKSLRPIAKDEEVLICYEYGLNGAPLWFKKYLLEFLEENPEGSDCTKFAMEGKTMQELKEDYEADLRRQNYRAV